MHGKPLDSRREVLDFKKDKNWRDTRERIRLLDEAQRRVIADVIGYIATW